MPRLHGFLIATTLSLVVPACEKADTAVPDEANESQTSQANADAEAAQADEEAAAREEEERKRQEEMAKKTAAAIEKMEAEYGKEAERWTAKLKKKVTKLAARKYKTGKQGIQAALKSPHREPNSPARDLYRHPSKTMAFFGLAPDMTVVEVSPGAGWYTELLAPVLAARGQLVVPVFDPASEDPMVRYFGRGAELMLNKSEELYGKVERVVSTDLSQLDMGEDGSADMVLVFRMLHNWHRNKQWDGYIKSVHAVLKPGGVLAVVQHRAPDGADPDETADKGYLAQDYVIKKMQEAGFKLSDQSEINANAKDTKDYPDGVWTLPPRLVKGEENKDKWLEIGESDRMTLKFVKE